MPKTAWSCIHGSPYRFIGSLVPTHHKALLDIPKCYFRALDEQGLPGLSAYHTPRQGFGAKRTVRVVCNENLFVAQSRTLLREIGKR